MMLGSRARTAWVRPAGMCAQEPGPASTTSLPSVRRNRPEMTWMIAGTPAV